MALSLSPAALAALRAERVVSILISRWHFDSGTVGYWMGDGVLPLGGVDYIGMGAFASITDVGSGQGLEARGIEVTLDGVTFAQAIGASDPMAAIAALESEPFFNRRVDIEAVHFDPDTNAYLFTRPVFSGLIDQTRHEEQPGGASTLTISLESLSIRFGRAPKRVRSHADQTAIYANDNGFKFTASSAAGEGQLFWGRKPPSTQKAMHPRWAGRPTQKFGDAP